MHRVVSEMLSVKSVMGYLPSERMDELVKEVKRYQARNRVACRSHEKRTRRALRERGIRLSEVQQCPRLC